MNEGPKVFDKSGKVSADFRSAFSQSGSDCIECTCCGRMHFCSNHFGGEEEDLKKLLQQEQEDPLKYINHEDLDCISWFNFGGQRIVFDCLCGFDVQLEKIIWASKRAICEYLVARAKIEKERSDSNLTSATKAAEAIEK